MNILYKIYSFLIALPLFIVLTMIVTILCSATAAFPFGDKFYCGITHFWGKATIALFLLPVETNGMEQLDPDQSYVFLANHQGYLDIFLCYGYILHDFKWMMKEYLKKLPMVGWACQNTHQIFVGENRASIKQAIMDSQATLRGGMSMIIFPEGTRTYDGNMNEFKRGAFMLANEIGLPIVPLTINGSFIAFNRKAKSVTRHKLTLTMHMPITAEERKGVPTKDLMDNIYNIIENDLWKV